MLEIYLLSNVIYDMPVMHELINAYHKHIDQSDLCWFRGIDGMLCLAYTYWTMRFALGQ